MGLKLQDKRTFEDILFWRAFRSSQVPMVQDVAVVDYNAHYLSVTYKLQVPGEDPETYYFVPSKGEIQARKPPLDYKKVWLKKYLDMFMQVEKRPWFLINGDTNLLSRLKFTGKEFEHLKNKEVAFYFYEPLFQRTPHSERCPAFGDHNTDLYFPELMWLEDFVHNHGGKIKAKAYVCDYDLKNLLQRRRLHPNIQIETWDIFLADLCRSLVEKEIDRDENFRQNGFPFQTQVTKKFICPNFRYEGVRELVVGFLKGSSFGHEGHTSFFHKHDRTHFLSELPFDPRSWEQWNRIQTGIEQMQPLLPMTLDSKNSKSLHPKGFSLPDGDGVSNIRTGYEFFQWYSEAFLAVVNETRFGTLCGEISEKTFVPILYMRPFVIFGAPKMLKYLREMGFETFSDFWDESYDDIEDHGQRMQALLKLLDSILKRPLQEHQEMLRKMQARLERNRNHLIDKLLPQMHDFILKENERLR